MGWETSEKLWAYILFISFLWLRPVTLLQLSFPLSSHGTNSEIRVSTECWPWRRNFSCRNCRDLNPQPFDHESSALITKLPHSLFTCAALFPGADSLFFKLLSACVPNEQGLNVRWIKVCSLSGLPSVNHHIDVIIHTVGKGHRN